MLSLHFAVRLREATSRKQRYSTNVADVAAAVHKSGARDSRRLKLQEIQRLSKGLARMAIGHRPFEEGEMPDGGYEAIDTDRRK
jgi:hypothetical protein